jgi:hypothetical protein
MIITYSSKPLLLSTPVGRNLGVSSIDLSNENSQSNSCPVIPKSRCEQAWQFIPTMIELNDVDCVELRAYLIAGKLQAGIQLLFPVVSSMSAVPKITIYRAKKNAMSMIVYCFVRCEQG